MSNVATRRLVLRGNMHQKSTHPAAGDVSGRNSR
jgi:hypothetical protein